MSLPVSARLGKRDVELFDDIRDCRLGPLNIKVAGDTRSTLGIEPWMEEFGFDPELEALDLDSGVSNFAV